MTTPSILQCMMRMIDGITVKMEMYDAYHHPLGIFFHKNAEHNSALATSFISFDFTVIVNTSAVVPKGCRTE